MKERLPFEHFTPTQMLQIGLERVTSKTLMVEGTSEVGLIHASFPQKPLKGNSPVLIHCTWRGLVSSHLSVLHFGLRKVFTWLCLHARSGAALAWAVSRDISLEDHLTLHLPTEEMHTLKLLAFPCFSSDTSKLQCCIPLLSYTREDK